MSERRKIHMVMGEGHKGEEASWLTSYGDTITILLCFFMLFFNISKTDPVVAEKIKKEMAKAGGYTMVAALKDKKLVKELEDKKLAVAPKNYKDKKLEQIDNVDDNMKGKKRIARTKNKRRSDLEKIHRVVVQRKKQRKLALAQDANDQNVKGQIKKRKVKFKLNFDRKLKQYLDEKKIEFELRVKEMVIRFKTDELFESGSPVLHFKARQLISGVVDELVRRKGNFEIIIEGHSDTAPLVGITLQKWRSNWDLSAARAVRVLDIFVTRGINERRLSAVGLGRSRPRVKDRDKKGVYIEKNRSINRRIEIRLRNRFK